MNQMREGITRAARGRLETTGDGGFRQEFRFPAAFVGFGGHFPGYPILPGVVQLLLAQWLVEAAQGRTLALREVGNAKFLEQLVPDCDISVSCRLRGEEQTGWWSARLEVAGRLAASFQLLLLPADN